MKSEKKIVLLDERRKSKLRKPILKELLKLEKKFGVEKVKYTMRWHLRIGAEMQVRQKKIKKLQKQVRDIKAGKSLYSIDY